MRDVYILGGIGLGLVSLPWLLRKTGVAAGGLALTGSVTKIAGDAVRTQVWAKNTGGVRGTWIFTYDFEHDVKGAPIKPYLAYAWTIEPGETKQIIEDTQTIPAGYEGYPYTLVIYWDKGATTDPYKMPYYIRTGWQLSIVSPAEFTIVDISVT